MSTGNNLEMPDQSPEALQALPIEVSWTDKGYSGSLRNGNIKKAIGEYFSIDLQGQSYNDLEKYESPGEYMDVPAHFGGSIWHDQNGDKIMSAGTLKVEDGFRRNRLGERLSMALVCVAVETGCKRIELSFSHPAALKIFRNIFGDDRIHFTEEISPDEFAPLDITPERADEIIQEERERVIKYGVQDGIWKHHPETDEEVLPGAVEGVDAWIDLEDFDTSGLEQPLYPTYSKQVAGTFLKSGDGFGSAEATAAELDALRELYQERGKDRTATLESIREDGYPIPEDVTPETLALAAAAHACGVTIDLAETRGLEGKDSSYESYTTKNRFDRFTALHLPKSLKAAWEAPVKRDPDANPAVVYPEGVDSMFIHGISAPHRYFPAQTMRYLEFARQWKLDFDAEKAMGIDKVKDLRQFAVDWEDLAPVIKSAKDINQLAGDLGAEIALRLLGNGLSQEQVTAILRKGFNVDDLKREHGNVPEADRVFESLISALNAHPETTGIGAVLTH